MNIVLYSRAQPSFSAEDLDLLINALDETGMSYRMNKDFAGLIGAKTAGRSVRSRFTGTAPVSGTTRA